jgi:parafibromin
MAPADLDPLLLLRQSIAANSAIFPTASDDASAPEVELSKATHLTFTAPSRISLPITTPTRFVSGDTAVDLRSIYFLWVKREVPIPEYNNAATKLDNELQDNKIHRPSYFERIELIAWLEGSSEESESIKPLAGDKDGATSNAAAALASKGAAAPAIGSTVGRSGKGTLDPRLAVIYNSERKMGDRNSVLRGIKPTVCPHPPTKSPCPTHLLSMTTKDGIAGLLPRPEARRSFHVQEACPADKQHSYQPFVNA